MRSQQIRLESLQEQNRLLLTQLRQQAALITALQGEMGRSGPSRGRSGSRRAACRGGRDGVVLRAVVVPRRGLAPENYEAPPSMLVGPGPFGDWRIPGGGHQAPAVRASHDT